MPRVLFRDENSITIEIEPAKNTNGPISAYQIIIVDETIPSVFNESQLSPYAIAQKEGLSYYIAAELSPDVSKMWWAEAFFFTNIMIF